MSSKRCPRCGKSYPSSYRSCPYCSERGRERRPAPAGPADRLAAFLRRNGDRVFLVATVFFLMIALLGMILTRCAGEPDPPPAPDNTAQQPEAEDPPPQTDPLTISAKTLSLTVGESAALTAEGGADLELALTWASSDETVAEVADGLVTAKAAGTATIQVSRGAEWGFCVVTVKEKDPEVEVSLNRTDFTLSTKYPSFQMQVLVKGTRRQYEGGVIWSIEGPSIATISETGYVERVKRGNTKITATMGSKVLECIVRVS